MIDTKSIITARGIATVALACAALVASVGSSAAAPMCNQGICVEVEPINNPAYVHFRVTKVSGSLIRVQHAQSRGVWSNVRIGELTYVPRGARSTWIFIQVCSKQAMPRYCGPRVEFTLAGIPGQKVEMNSDRPGSDYRRFEIPIRRYQSCKEACEADGKCKAYTYVWPGVQGPKSVCYLKDSIPNRAASRCCVSGVIRVVASTTGPKIKPLGKKSTQAAAPHPATCKSGFVWRVARADDLVCVTPESRNRVAKENATAASRAQPGGGAYGPNTCRPGFVWREAFKGDVVCVTPKVRSAVREENRLAASRRVQ